ncbi:alpha/beta-hydrolase [Cadophora sp. DSE1049]|nr:alpha/beta-hydrolase [Cadophora sp. DSE1049]
MPYITHPSGVKTFYRDDDFADPWVPHETIPIQHGFGRSSAFWYKWIPILAKKYRVIRRDALGHGYSSGAPPGHPLTIESVSAEIIDTLDQLSLSKVHYLGESTAGIFASFLGSAYPDRFLSVSTCGSPLNLPPAAQETLSFGNASCPESVRKLGARAWGERFVKLSATDEGTDGGFLRWYLEQFAIPSTQGLCDYAEMITKKGSDAHLVMRVVRVPMLLLTPANSALVPLDDQKELVKYAGAKMEIIEGHGHEIYLDQAEKCQQKYLQFLDEIRRK